MSATGKEPENGVMDGLERGGGGVILKGSSVLDDDEQGLGFDLLA